MSTVHVIYTVYIHYVEVCQRCHWNQLQPDKGGGGREEQHQYLISQHCTASKGPEQGRSKLATLLTKFAGRLDQLHTWPLAVPLQKRTSACQANCMPGQLQARPAVQQGNSRAGKLQTKQVVDQAICIADQLRTSQLYSSTVKAGSFVQFLMKNSYFFQKTLRKLSKVGV